MREPQNAALYFHLLQHPCRAANALTGKGGKGQRAVLRVSEGRGGMLRKAEGLQHSGEWRQTRFSGKGKAGCYGRKEGKGRVEMLRVGEAKCGREDGLGRKMG